MNDTDKIVAAILASGFCTIKAHCASVTEADFVDTYEHVLQVMEKRGAVAEGAAKFDEETTLQVVRYDEEDARKRSL